jgi:hypothetical protein
MRLRQPHVSYHPLTHTHTRQALITTEGGRRASIAQGQALLRLACEAFPALLPHHRELLRAARDRVRSAYVTFIMWEVRRLNQTKTIPPPPPNPKPTDPMGRLPPAPTPPAITARSASGSGSHIGRGGGVSKRPPRPRLWLAVPRAGRPDRDGRPHVPLLGPKGRACGGHTVRAVL